MEPYYCHENGRPGIDPVVLIKMVLIQHLFGIASLRQTHREIQVNLAYRWFLGYGLLEKIPHFATVSYAFCRRFPEELTEEIFEHILNKALNNRMIEPSAVFIDGTHIKASANKKKFQKEQVARAAKAYTRQLREEVNAERERLGKKPIEDDDDEDGTPGGGTVEKTVSTTDRDAGMFVKGEHERQFAYEAHTACDKHGFVLGVEVTAGNVHDSAAWDGLDNHEDSAGVYVTFSVDGEAMCIHAIPLDGERSDIGTKDVYSEAVGFVTFEEVDPAAIPEEFSAVDVENMDELITQSTRVAVYAH